MEVRNLGSCDACEVFNEKSLEKPDFCEFAAYASCG